MVTVYLRQMLGSIRLFQTVGTTLDPTTTSTDFVDLPEMSITITTGANPVLILFTGVFSNKMACKGCIITLVIDGTEVAPRYRRTCASSTADAMGIITLACIEELSTGTHTIKIQWKIDAGTGVAIKDTRALQVIDFVR